MAVPVCRLWPITNVAGEAEMGRSQSGHGVTSS